jgi:hypothetical protein
MEAVLYFRFLAVLGGWALFWIVRLGVRYGMNDALRMNRYWLVPDRDRRPTDL